MPKLLPALGFLAVVEIPAPAAQPRPDLETRFEFLHNQIVLSVQINGQGPFDVLVDSGTHASSIDLKLARRLKLKLGPATPRGTGAGAGRVRGYPTVCNELRIGDLSARDLPAVALDLSRISREMGRPIHGVLGHSFLASRIVQIDYFARKIRFFRESPFGAGLRPEDSAQRLSFPMQFRAGSILPVLEDCYVNGKRLAVTLDTGSSLGLILFPAAIAYLGVGDLAREGIPLSPEGYAGKARLTKGWVRSLTLRDVALGAVEAAYVLKGYGEREDLGRRSGNLGNAILQDFALTLDYRNRVVVLEAVEE